MRTLIISVALICIIAQFLVKRALISSPKQYGYFRDILFAGAWLVLAACLGTFDERVIVAGALLSGIAGITESIYSDVRWRLLFFAAGALCAFYGPSVSYIRFPDGAYIYLTPGLAFAADFFWFSFFPFVFIYLDEVPGLTGHVLAVSYVLMLSACFITRSEAIFLSFAGLALLVAFWSRFGNVYRQAGRALASFWGVLVAGTAITGNSKGIVLSTVLFLAFGLFAIPAIELFFNFVRGIFSDENQDRELNTEKIYKHMLNDGFEHSGAVQYVAGMCALTGLAAAWNYYAVILVVIIFFIVSSRKKRREIISRPSLWGVKLDNVSMNYAITKARGLISNPGGNKANLIVTLNAIGIETAIHDEEFADVVKNASMVLADGAGLRIGMSILNMPIQERVAGIDFAEKLCRLAAVEKWPIYFVGAEGDTAEVCAENLSKKFPGLVIAGTHDGFFDIRSTKIPEDIKNSGAKILLVAMGQPRQEKWVMRHREKLGSVLAVGVGGAFDVFAGKLTRAPLWIQKIGFEWLYRMIQEPSRWRRNLTLFVFVFRILATKIGLHKK